MALEHAAESLWSVAPLRVGRMRAKPRAHTGRRTNRYLVWCQSADCVSANWRFGPRRSRQRGRLARGCGVGTCRRFALGAQLSAALGGAQARQNLAFGGDIHQNGAYCVAGGDGALAPLGPVAATATATTAGARRVSAAAI